MEKFCDLHTHSNFSDGTYTPSELIDAAVDIGLASIALCDHNTVDGLPEFLDAAVGKNIEAIAGAEFSVNYKRKELHLLGLYIPENQFPKIDELMKDVNVKKEESNRKLIAALNADGYDISFEKIKQSTRKGNFNRSHIAIELTELGYTESKDHAFATLLSPEAGYYEEPDRLLFFDMVRYLKSIGAVPVLAHPFLNLSEEELVELLPLAKAEGLVGMECYYPEYDEETTRKALMLAEKYDLKYSGGSDFHGDKKPDIMLGTGKGNLKIPNSWATALK